MYINGINYLLLERRGCNFFPNEEIAKKSDVGNYRVFVRFTDKNGVEVCGDFTKGYIYDTTKGKPRISSDISLWASLCYCDDNGNCWGYYPAVDSREYTYNLADILAFVNAISAERYDAIKWVEYVEFTQDKGANFVPADKIVNWAKENRLETGYHFDAVTVTMYTGTYKYLAYNIEPVSEKRQKVTIILEEV